MGHLGWDLEEPWWGVRRKGQGWRSIKGHRQGELQVPGRRRVRAQHCSLTGAEAGGEVEGRKGLVW